MSNRPLRGRPLRAAASLLVLWVGAATAAWAEVARTDWPLARGDAANRGAIRLQTTRPAGKLSSWRFRGGSHVWGYRPGMSVWSSAAVGLVDGEPVVLAGSYDHNVYCLDARTGRRRWRFTTGGGVYATPLLWNGPQGPLVFVAASDRTIYALDARLGRRLWAHPIEAWRPTIGGARLASPAVGRVGARAAVFAGHWVWDKSLAGHQQAGGVSALDVRDGRRLWSAPLGDTPVSSPLYVELARGGTVFVAAENGNLHALDADSGAVLWTDRHRNVIKAAPAVFQVPAGPRVVIGSKHGRLRCLDARDGSLRWQLKTGHWIDGSAAVTRIGGRAVVLVGSYDMHLYALDGASGRVLWRFRTAGGIYSSPAVLHWRGRTEVLFAAWDHHLYSVAGENGALQWKAFMGRPLWDSLTLGDSTWASPTVAELDGHAMAYFGSYAGPFYGLPLDEAPRRLTARSTSNVDFWITLPAILLLVTALAIFLTRRSRDHSR